MSESENESVGRDFGDDYDDADDDYPGGWFGESWGAPVCEDAEHHRPTPVGEPCEDCRAPIADGDRGLIVPHAYRADDGTIAGRLYAMHIACLLRGLNVGATETSRP